MQSSLALRVLGGTILTIIVARDGFRQHIVRGSLAGPDRHANGLQNVSRETSPNRRRILASHQSLMQIAARSGKLMA
jgi:hypothetical protein